MFCFNQLNIVRLAVSIFFFVLLSPVTSGQALYFIFNGPVKMIPGTPKVWYETRIYRFDEDTKILEEVWTLGELREANKVGIYCNPKVVLISDYSDLYVIPMDDVEHPIPIGLQGTKNFHYFEVKDGLNLIEVKIVVKDKDNFFSYKYEIYTDDGNPSSVDVKSSDFSGEIRLSGPRPIGINESDIIQLGDIHKEKLRSVDTEYLFSFAPIPDGIIQQGSTRGWVLIANEPGFYALYSIPDKNDLKQRELLIYNRLKQEWKSIMIDGVATHMGLINGWLIGRFMESNPEDDIEKRKLFPPTVRDSVFLINPVDFGYFPIPLGHKSAILWIESNMVYLRERDKLFKARFENGALVNKEFLIADTSVNFFRCGFRGQPPEQ